MDDLTVLKELRQEWDNTIAKSGGHCPCCDRWGKINAFTLHHNLALALKWMYEYTKRSSKPWVYVVEEAPRQVLRTRGFCTLEYWGLVVRHPKFESEVDTSHSDEDGKPKKRKLGKKKSSGLWQITPLGIDFVEGKTLIVKTVFIYNKEVQGKSLATVSFEDCLGELYHYGASMSKNISDEELE